MGKEDVQAQGAEKKVDVLDPLWAGINKWHSAKLSSKVAARGVEEGAYQCGTSLGGCQAAPLGRP